MHIFQKNVLNSPSINGGVYRFMRSEFKILCKHHKEWVIIVRSFGAEYYAEDIVQEFYIRLFDMKGIHKAVVNNEPNRAYIWISLKNIFLTFEKQKSKFNKIPLDEVRSLSYEAENVLKHESFDIIHHRIYNEINSWSRYDKELFTLYMKNKISLRDISKGANISLSSIFNTIKTCKDKLRKEIGEDYQDYLNQEYELI